MDKTLVSIVVPVYNVQNYVRKCLESLAQQSYDKLEIIIVDDGSTDESGKICDDFAKTENRAKIFHKKNGGLSDARNYGIKKSKGQLIAFIDGDDYVEKDFIKDMLEAREQCDVDIVVCGFNKDVPKKDIVSGEEATIRLLIEQENIDIVACNKLYKKELFINNDIWYPFGMKYEDTLTTYKLFSRAKKVAYINKSLYRYIKREGSIMSGGKTVDRLDMRELAAREAIEYFKDNNELSKAAEVSLLLAKYAYIDEAVRGEISEEYYNKNIEWIKKNRKKYRRNEYLTKKLKLYNFLVVLHGYKIFRKII